MPAVIAQPTIDAVTALVAAIKADAGGMPSSVQINVNVTAGAGRANITVQQPDTTTTPPVTPANTFAWSFTAS